MSSEENKSQSEAKNKYNQKSMCFNSDLNIIQEPQLPKEKQTEQESIKFFEQKADNYSINNASIDKDFSSPIKLDNKFQNTNSSLGKNKKINYFKSNKINLFDKKENSEKIFCNCTKTRCKKKYCECFANNKLCKDCNCINCLNTNLNSNNDNNSPKESSENEEIFCTCTKSNCNKKYCECYKLGKKCNDRCKCSNCLNSIYPLFNIKNKDDNSKENINDSYNNNNSNELKDKKEKKDLDLDENKSNLNSGKSSSNDDSDESFQIQRISIFINQYQTLVNVEKFTKEDMMLISKKRYNNE